jgi:hypothetical protein
MSKRRAPADLHTFVSIKVRCAACDAPLIRFGRWTHPEHAREHDAPGQQFWNQRLSKHARYEVDERDGRDDAKYVVYCATPRCKGNPQMTAPSIEAALRELALTDRHAEIEWRR